MLLRKTIYLINKDNKNAWMKLLSKRPEIVNVLSSLPDGTDSRQFRVIRKAFRAGWSVEQMKSFIESYSGLGEKDFENRFIYENLLKKKQEGFYNFSREQRNEIFEGLQNNLTVKQVEIYANVKLAYKQMREIRWALERGIDSDLVKCYAQPEFCVEQMREIFKGFNNGLNMSQVGIYAKSDIESRIMRRVRWLFEYGIDREEVLVCIKDSLKYDQICEICMGFEFGLSKEQVEKYADPKYSAEEMKKIRLELEQEEMLAKAKISDNEELFNLLDV